MTRTDQFLLQSWGSYIWEIVFWSRYNPILSVHIESYRKTFTQGAQLALLEELKATLVNPVRLLPFKEGAVIWALLPSKFLLQTFVFQLLLEGDDSHKLFCKARPLFPEPLKQQGREQEEGLERYLFITVDMDTFNWRGKTLKPKVMKRKENETKQKKTPGNQCGRSIKDDAEFSLGFRIQLWQGLCILKTQTFCIIYQKGVPLTIFIY